MVTYGSFKRNMATARLISGLIDVVDEGSACLRFYYHMHGSDMGTLNVYVKNKDGSLLKNLTISGEPISMPSLHIIQHNESRFDSA